MLLPNELRTPAGFILAALVALGILSACSPPQPVNSVAPQPTDLSVPGPPQSIVPESPKSITPDNLNQIVELERWGRGRIYQATLSPNGELLAVISGIGIWLYPVDTLDPIGFIDDPAASIFDIASLTWSPDSTQIATAKNQIVRIWNARGQLLFSIDPATAVWWSPDATRLAVTQSNAVQVWTAAGQLLHTLKGSIVTWSPDGARLATLTARGTGRIWDTATGQELVTFHATVQNPNSLAWSTDGRSIAISATGVELIDAVTGQNLQALDTDHVLSQVRWSPDGSMFVVPFSVGRYSTSALIAHDTSTATPLLDLTSGVMWTPIDFAWSPNSQWLAIGNSGRSDGLYSIDKTKHLLNKAVDLQGAQVVWSPTGNSLAVSRNGRIDLWDPVSRRLQRSLLLGTDLADDIVWAGDRLVSVNTISDYLIRWWNPTDGTLVRASDAHQSYGRELSWSPDGRQLAFIDSDNVVRLWDASNGQLLQAFASQSGHVWSLAWSPDGQQLISGGADKQIHVWDVTHTAEVRKLSGQWGSVTGLAWSSDRKRFASAGDYLDGAVIVWDAATGQQLQVIEGDPGGARNIAWSPDGLQLAGVSHDKPAIWNAAGTHLLQLDQAHAGTYYSVERVSWSPDGSRLAATGLFGSRNAVLIWNTSSYNLERTLEGETAGSDVAWSPNGELLAALGGPLVSIWDTRTWQPIATLQLRTAGGNRIAWSPNGELLAVGLMDGTIRIWGLPTR